MGPKMSNNVSISSYRPLKQHDEEGISNKNCVESAVNPPKKASFGSGFLLSHLLIFIAYTLGLIYVLKRPPSDTACDAKFSTKCRATLPIICSHADSPSSCAPNYHLPASKASRRGNCTNKQIPRAAES